MKPTFKIHAVDTHWHRVIYKTKNDQGQTVYYCLSPERKPWSDERIVKLYRTTRGPDFEPEYEIERAFDPRAFEMPTDDSTVSERIREYFVKRGAK
jgi:hypothetical protein